MIHISLDLETWGKRAGYDLRSIGACVFDPITGVIDSGCESGQFYIATDNPILSEDERPINQRFNDKLHKYPLKRDPSTVQWWSEQSAEAQAAFTNPVDLYDALLSLTTWLQKVTREARRLTPPRYIEGLRDSRTGETEMIDAQIIGVDHDQFTRLDRWAGLRLWTHGPGFDPPILEAAFHACGLPVPWFYRAPRDTRTLFDAAGIDPEADGSYRTFMSQYNTGTAHNALDDAIAQARCICAATARISEWSKAYNRMQDDGK